MGLDRGLPSCAGRGENGVMGNMEERARAFVWPPKPMREETPAPVAGSEATARLSGVGDAKPADARTGRGGRLGGWLRELERVWLDPIAQPLAIRAREWERDGAESGMGEVAGGEGEGWLADETGVYCDRCGGDVGEHECHEFGCARCRDARLRWRRVVRLGRYAPPLSEWVCEVKFSRSVRLGLELGEALGLRIAAALEQERRGIGGALAAEGGLVVVPTPTHAIRRLTRGLDHTAVIAQGVARALGAPMVKALRSGRRPSQRTLSATARLRNLVGSMSVRKRVLPSLAGKLVILVDDVSTTGATLKEASRALLAPFQEKRGGRADGSAGLPGRPVVWVGVLAVTGDRALRG